MNSFSESNPELKGFLYHDKPNDAIRGKKVIIQARKIEKPSQISKRTHKHGGMRTSAEDAIAYVQIPYKWAEIRYKWVSQLFV